MRCERCKTSDLTLVTFGIYDCPTCGRVDADGNLLEPAPFGEGRADSTQPTILDTGRASFVAPPPPSPITASVVRAAPTTSAPSGGLPMLLLGTIVALLLVDAAEAIQTNSPLSLMLEAGTMIPLLTGKRWARTLAMGGAVLMIGLAAMLFVALRGPYGVAAAVTIATNAWWLYVLLRPDTVAYFSRT